MSYSDKIAQNLEKMLSPGLNEISPLTDDPKKFIKTVKELMDAGHFKKITFTSCYKFLKMTNDI